MSRFFDGFGDDSITLSIGACASVLTNWSMAILHRPASGFCGLFHTEHPAGTVQEEIWGEGGNYFIFPGGFSSGPAPLSGQWQVIGASHTAGTTTPRYHLVPLDGGGAGTWVDQDGSATSANATGPLDQMVIGHGTVRKGNGLIAAVALWDRTFTDTEWHNDIGFVSAQAWFNTLPKGMWLLNQSSTAQPVLDVTGGGANQTATTNPAVSGTDPPGWSYALTTLASGSLFLPFFR